MANKIFNGDKLHCRKLESSSIFKNDKTIYVLSVRGYGKPMIKYVKHIKGHSLVTLVSENQIHKPFDVNSEDIISIYEVIKVEKKS